MLQEKKIQKKFKRVFTEKAPGGVINKETPRTGNPSVSCAHHWSSDVRERSSINLPKFILRIEKIILMPS